MELHILVLALLLPAGGLAAPLPEGTANDLLVKSGELQDSTTVAEATSTFTGASAERGSGSEPEWKLTIGKEPAKQDPKPEWKPLIGKGPVRRGEEAYFLSSNDPVSSHEGVLSKREWKPFIGKGLAKRDPGPRWKPTIGKGPARRDRGAYLLHVASRNDLDIPSQREWRPTTSEGPAKQNSEPKRKPTIGRLPSKREWKPMIGKGPARRDEESSFLPSNNPVSTHEDVPSKREWKPTIGKAPSKREQKPTAGKAPFKR